MPELRDREASLAEGNRAFAELAAALDADPERALHGEDGTPWTARDVYTHLHRWQLWTIDAISESLATGREVVAYTDETEMDALNEIWRSQTAALTFAEARSRCLESREQMLESFLALADDDWQRWGPAYGAEFDGSHYVGHLGYLGDEVAID